MKIPTFIVTGYLDAGKTSFIESMLREQMNQNKRVLVFLFERGDCELRPVKKSLTKITFDVFHFEEQLAENVSSMKLYLTRYHPEEVWVEWNGMISFSMIERMFLESGLDAILKLQKVIYIGKEEMLKSMTNYTGEAPISLIQNADIAYITGQNGQHNSVLRGWNRELPIYYESQWKALVKTVYEKKRVDEKGYFFLSCILFLLVVTTPILEQFGGSTNRLITNFIGIILQAIPFLLIGVLLSSFIQVYISKERMEQIFQRNIGAGMLLSIIMGFFLPVCDCTSIPVFKSIVKKGVPLSMAVTFMTVSPVINPVVLLSTYYAFQGDMDIVFTRALLGIVCAIIIGLSFTIFTPNKILKEEGAMEYCNCGCEDFGGAMSLNKTKFYLFIRHAQVEFFLVARYLMYGSLISIVLQMFDTDGLLGAGASSTLLQLLCMMGLSFLFSLCSSSDAIIAKSYASRVCASSMMGFLVFGPMMDLKNIFMLSSSFRHPFVLRLLITTVVVCFTVIAIAYSLGIGGLVQ